MINSILFISAFPPCQATAGQDYSRRLIEDLVKKGIHIDLVYAEYPGHKPEIPDSVNVLYKIVPSLKNCIKQPTAHPFFSKRYDPGALECIRKCASNYDMLYFDFSQVHIYSTFIKHPCKILMCHDIIFQKYSRKFGRINVKWIQKTEGKLLRTAKRIYTFSHKDTNILKTVYKADSIPVRFYLKDTYINYSNIKVGEAFCFYGAWNRRENSEALLFFIRKVRPLLTKEYQYFIIGGGMPFDLRQEVELIKGMNILGFVDDPVKIIASCQALIAPLHQGAGVKVKVVDALTSGTIVIGTDITFEGLEDNTCFPLFIHAKKPQDYANVLNNWKYITSKNKQSSSKEFINRYNNNHFPEKIASL